MEYVTGLAHGIAFCAVVLAAYTVGKRDKRRPKPTPQPVDEEARRKAEEFQKHFAGMFNYDVKTALKRKE